MTGTPSPQSRTTVDPAGRVVIPAESRKRHGIKPGDTVLVENGEHGLRILTQGEALREAQAYFVQLAPADVVLSDELLRDRRAEAAGEGLE